MAISTFWIAIDWKMALNAVVPQGPSLRGHEARSTMKRVLAKVQELWDRLHISRLGEYSGGRIEKLQKYCETTSLLRALVVCVLMPWPALVCELLMELVPLQDPDRGWKANYGAWIRLYLVMVFAALGSLLQIRASTPELSPWKIVAISVGASLVGTSIILLLSSQWVFPLPFGFIGSGSVWASVFVICLLVAIRRSHSSVIDANSLAIAEPLRRKIYLIVLQVIFVAIYDVFSILFERGSTAIRIGLFLVLPMLKLAFRHVVAWMSSDDRESILAVVVFSVDVLQGLYSSICIQTSGSWWTAVMIIMLNGVHSAFLFRQINQSAKSFREHNQPNKLLRERSLTLKSATLQTTESDDVEMFNSPMALKIMNAGLTARKHDALTSRILFQLEYRVLVGYIEAIIPMLYTVHLAILVHLPSAKYYPHTRSITPANLRTNIRSILAYAATEILSLVWLQVIVKRKFGFSLLYHLAFVLETETELLQGRLFVWIVVLLQLTLVHFGTSAFSETFLVFLLLQGIIGHLIIRLLCLASLLKEWISAFNSVG